LIYSLFSKHIPSSINLYELEQKQTQ